MKKQFLPILLLVTGISVAATAQTKDKVQKEKSDKESITIRKKADSKEKLTIVVDGDNITVNGKPIEEMKDSDVEILRNRGITSLMPKIRSRIAPMGSMKMFGDDNFNFNFSSNRALLGVVSEKSDKGAKISSVEKESAAEKAGLAKEDIITRIGDTKITGSEDLYEAIGKYKPEEKVGITYLRDDKEASTTATLGQNKSVEVKNFNFDKLENLGDHFRFEMPELPRMNGMDVMYTRRPRIGMEIQDVEEGKGVKVLDVDNDTPAAKAGLQKDDVISEIGGKAIASVDELKSKLKDLKEGDSISVTYQRSGKTQTTNIKLPKKLKTADL
ncbi:MAG: PDZ domain-containing protein [Bacteroidota bacterium]